MLQAPPELDFAAAHTEAENAEGVCFIFLMALAGWLLSRPRQKGVPFAALQVLRMSSQRPQRKLCGHVEVSSSCSSLER